MAHNSAEHSLKVESRADGLTNLTQRSQLANRLRQFSRPRLQFLEQPDIFNGDHRLVGESFKKLDLRRGEGAHLEMSCRQHPSEFSVLTKRNGQVGARAARENLASGNPSARLRREC